MRSVTRIVGPLAVAVVAAAGCGKSKPQPAPQDPHPSITTSPSKQTGRLNILQLRGSFPVVLGTDKQGRPITWNSGTSSAPVSGFDTYARTLGEADFINRTEDDHDVSPLYVKFMDDAARSACSQALSTDLSRANPEERTLLRHVSPTDTPATNAEGFRKNLAYLKLRFHGIKVTDDATLEPLQTLFTNAGKSSQSPIEDGWQAVCVALLTAPEFHLY